MIENAQPIDSQSILRLVQATAVFNDEEILCVDEIWNEYVSLGAEKSGYNVIVYRDQNHVLGFACYGAHPLTIGTFDLYWIAVDPKAQGRGIGQDLIAATEQGVIDRHGRKLVIETSSTPAYAPARRLYEHCEYVLEASLHDFYAEGDDLLIYSKSLIVQDGADHLLLKQCA